MASAEAAVGADTIIIIMVQCLDGVRQLVAVLFRCFDLELKQPRGLEDPQVLARETVCTSPVPLSLSLLLVSSASCRKLKIGSN